MRIRILAVAAAALVLSAPARAQHAPPALDPGTRIRVTLRADSSRMLGDFVSLDWSALTIRDDQERAEARPWTSIALVERGDLSRGRSAWRGGTWGAFLGFSVGWIAGALSAQEIELESTESMVIGGLGLGTIGTGIGAGAGALLARIRWQPVIAVPEPSPTPPAAYVITEAMPAVSGASTASPTDSPRHE